MMLDECVDTPMFLQSIAELEYAKNITDVGQMRYGGADIELEKLAKEVSQHAYHLVDKQYRVANDHNVFELTTTQEPERKYHVDTKTYRCSYAMGRNGTPVFLKMLEALKHFEKIAITGETPVFQR
eukprot:jgi/Phyca11/21505/fgenesh1_pg.PHYCAscaffold_99_\